jgi:glycerol uptake facilitator protein
VSVEETQYWQKLLAEVFGTGFLVFIGVGSVPATLILLGDRQPFGMAELGIISFAFTMVVIAMIYAIGHISGCHINPAITVALAATGKFPWRQVPGYLGAQVVGAVLGSYAIVATLGAKAHELGLGVASYGTGVGGGRALFAELIGTAVLAFTVFGAIDRRAPAGWAGLAIGFAVFAAIIVVAPATGASINPARTLGPMFALQTFGGTVHWSQLPVYWLGEFAGAILAGLAYFAMATTRTAAQPVIPEYPLRAATTETATSAS